MGLGKTMQTLSIIIHRPPPYKSDISSQNESENSENEDIEYEEEISIFDEEIHLEKDNYISDKSENEISANVSDIEENQNQNE